MRLDRLGAWERGSVGAWALTLALLLLPGIAQAQSPAPPVPSSGIVGTRSSNEYDRSGVWRYFLGEGWRDVWRAPIAVPVLDLSAYAGGLKPFRRGGHQSSTLHFHGADGRRYVFRSTDKDINEALPDDLKNTPIGDVIRDQAAGFHPTGHLAVAVMQDALGLLFAPPALVVLPDDGRLGEFRADFAGMLGLIEERPDDPEKGKTFANAEKIVGADKLLENLDESMEDRFDSRDYLRVRLFDFIIGDTDRGGDNVDFAKFESGERDTYRTIPRDRDYAFIRTEGLLMDLAGAAYPKLVRFSSKPSSLRALTFSTIDFDRSQLVDLPWATWDSVVTFIRQQLSNDVIDRAIMQLPETHRQESGGVIATGLRARRDALRAIAQKYYHMVNEDADIFASDENERAEIERNPDGSVTVRIWREGAGSDVATNGTYTPVFERRFVPNETQEIRVFLERGNDRAVVRGAVESSIELRVIGGEGDDVLVDSSHVTQGDKTHFYDASGNNIIVAGAKTRVIRKPFVTPPPKRSFNKDEEKPEENPRTLSEERRGRFKDLQADPESFVEEKTQQQAIPTWGKQTSWGPVVDYRQGSGLVVGIGPTITDYGFRRTPHESQISMRGMVGLSSGKVGIEFDATRHFEVSPWSLSLFAHATQLEANRFFGYGNDSEFIDRSLSLVRRDELLLKPALNYELGTSSTMSFGPVVKYVRPHVVDGSAAALFAPLGASEFGQLGGRADLVIDRSNKGTAQQSGFEFSAGASGYPTGWDVSDPFGETHALAQLFLPVGSQTFALRAGGQRVWGTFPLHEAAFIGGRHTLRGFAWNRFAGDASAFGAAELRVPITRITLLTRGDFGIIGFADAGRVWLDGESEGGWHTSTGGGVWFGSLGQSASLTYAKGEESRVYLSLGLPF